MSAEGPAPPTLIGVSDEEMKSYSADQQEAMKVILGIFGEWGQGKFMKAHPENDAALKKSMSANVVFSSSPVPAVTPVNLFGTTHTGLEACGDFLDWHGNTWDPTNIRIEFIPAPSGTNQIILKSCADITYKTTGKTAKDHQEVQVITLEDGKIAKQDIYILDCKGMADLMTEGPAPPTLIGVSDEEIKSYSADQQEVMKVVLEIFGAWGEGKFTKAHPENDATMKKYISENAIISSSSLPTVIPGNLLGTTHTGIEGAKDFWDWHGNSFDFANMRIQFFPAPSGTNHVCLKSIADMTYKPTGKTAKDYVQIVGFTIEGGKCTAQDVYVLDCKGMADIMV